MSSLDMYSYLQEIMDGFARGQLTDRAGNILPLEQGAELWADAAQKVKSQGGLLFFCGNGASCTMAEHMSHDWFQNAQINTLTCAETAHLTAISNDISYEDVFAYRISRILTQKDALVAVSSSGNSPNIIRAIEAARAKKSFVVTLSGKDADNKCRRMGDLNFWIPLSTYGLVESAHAVLLHAALDHYLDKYMGGRH